MYTYIYIYIYALIIQAGAVLGGLLSAARLAAAALLEPALPAPGKAPVAKEE